SPHQSARVQAACRSGRSQSRTVHAAPSEPGLTPPSLPPNEEISARGPNCDAPSPSRRVESLSASSAPANIFKCKATGTFMSQNKSDLLEPPFAHPSEGHHSDVAPLASGNHDRNRRSKAFPTPAATGFGLTTGEGSPELGSLGLGGTIKGIMSPVHEVDAAKASPAVNRPNNRPPTPARAKPLHMPEPPSSHALSPEEIAEPPLAVMSRSRAPFHAPMPATAAPLGQVRTAQRRPAPAPAPVEAMGERAPVGKGGTVVGEAAINFPGLAPSPAGFAGPGGTVVADERMPGKNPLLPAGPGGTVVADDSDPHFAALIGSSKSPPSRRSAPPRAMPKRIGQYELIRELGRGG